MFVLLLPTLFCLPLITDISTDDVVLFAPFERDKEKYRNHSLNTYILQLNCDEWCNVMVTLQQSRRSFSLSIFGENCVRHAEKKNRHHAISPHGVPLRGRSNLLTWVMK